LRDLELLDLRVGRVHAAVVRVHAHLADRVDRGAGKPIEELDGLDEAASGRLRTGTVRAASVVCDLGEPILELKDERAGVTAWLALNSWQGR